MLFFLIINTVMSAASDLYEKEVADYISSFGVKATRPSVSVKYPDVKITHNNATTWLEVKMNHTDNLGNTRVSYMSGEWDAAKPLDPVKKFAIEYLSKSRDTETFLKSIAKFCAKDWHTMVLPSTKGPLKDPKAIPYASLVEYFKTRTQYILDVPKVDLGKLVTDHYIEGKAEPAHYLQAGDDFYMIGRANPLKLPKNIPVLGVTGGKCEGNFKMRIGVRSANSAYYEIQPEIKIQNMGKSKYSVKPGTTKLNPFLES
tara:strand:- start:624 stop:1397 length:774 start_codon:yes stop_codon:yes gene_type:complete